MARSKREYSGFEISVLALLGGILGFVLDLALSYFERRPFLLLHALFLSVICYSIGISAGLLETIRVPIGVSSSARAAEIVVATLGIVAGALLLWVSLKSSSRYEVRLALLAIVPSAATILPQRKPALLAATFAVLSVATLRLPLISTHPPFISLGVLFGLAGLYSLAQMFQMPGRRRLVPISRGLAAGFMTLLSLYMLVTTMGLPDSFPWWIFIFPFAFFAYKTFDLLAGEMTTRR